MAAVAGTKFTNPWLVWLSQTFVYCLIFITAVSRGGVVEQGVVSYIGIVGLMPAPFGLADLEGIFTGVWMLACVSLLKINSKVRTKAMCLWSFDVLI